MSQLSPEEYAIKMEKKIVSNFLKEFYEKMGYYPTVITKKSVNSEEGSTLNILNLEELEQYFLPYTPTFFGKKTSLKDKSRKLELVMLRHIYCYVAKTMGYSLKSIGIYLGNRDHATIINSINVFKNLYETSSSFRQKYHNIINQIKADGNYYNTPAMVSSDQAQCQS